MKVVYFHQHFSTPKGSVGTRSYEMARHLLDLGHQVTMVCGSYGGGHTGLTGAFRRGRRTGVVDGIEIVEFDLSYSNSDGYIKRSATFFRFALRSIGLALTTQYDILFATSTPLTAGLPGIAARWLRNRYFVFEVRDLWPELPREMGVITNPVVLFLMDWLEWAAYHSAHRLIGLSPGIVDGIAKRGIPRGRVALVPNGCDLDIFGNVGDPWRPDTVSETDLMAIFAGTHGVANGLDAVISAAIVLQRRRRHDIKLVLVGDGKLKPDLQARAQAERLSNVIFHEPVSKTRLAGLMAASDVGMQTLANVPAFYYGTSPNKFFDYIAAGLPVLNNYPGWLADLINENRCGFVVPPECPERFADALSKAADDRVALKAMGLNARRLAERQFGRKALADQFCAWIFPE